MPPRTSTDALAKGDEVVAWIEKHCVHVKGQWAGQPLLLQPWQRDLVRELFGTLQPDGRRQYRTALIGIARKNGKSLLGAALALRHCSATVRRGPRSCPPRLTGTRRPSCSRWPGAWLRPARP